MRPIDADALRDELQKEIDKAIPPFTDTIGAIRCGVRLARNIAEDQPTVDAIPVEWIKEWVNEIDQHVPAYNDEEKKIIVGDYEEMFEVWEKLKEE